MSEFLEDREQFSSLYRAHARGLLVYFTRRTFDAELALDLTAETFAQAYSARARFRGTTDEEAGGWLYTIARRQLARYFEAGAVQRRLMERLGVQRPHATDAEIERIEELAGLEQLRGTLREQLAELGPGVRDALWLRVVDEQPYATVATMLGITEQTARARVSRALKTVAEGLAAVPQLTPEDVR
jgi:RNA polymerase sigma-70 factor (ECF subfamily)